MEKPALSISNIRFQYPDNGKAVFNSLSLTIPQFQGIVTLTGRSGSGKTTLAKLVAGLLMPSSGSIRLYSKPLDRSLNRVTLVFQEPTCFWWMSSLDNVAQPFKIRGFSKRESRARALDFLGFVGLERNANLLPHQLSLGMQRRLCIARALATHTDLIILDEPFASLDLASQEKLVTALRDTYYRFGSGFLLITHNLDLALRISHYIVCLDDSRQFPSEAMVWSVPNTGEKKMELRDVVTRILNRR